MEVVRVVSLVPDRDVHPAGAVRRAERAPRSADEFRRLDVGVVQRHDGGLRVELRQRLLGSLDAQSLLGLPGRAHPQEDDGRGARDDEPEDQNHP